MLNGYKIDREIKVLELLTSLSIIFIAYGFFYQYFFFEAIGIGWASNLLSANLILLTSIKILVTSLISIAIGYGLAHKFYLSKNDHLLTMLFLIICILNGLLGGFFTKISIELQKNTSLLLIALYTLSTSYFFFILFKLIFRIKLAKFQGVNYRPALIFVYFLIPFLFLFVPWNIAHLESSKVTNSPDVFYSKAIMASDKSEWYLISVTGEKALVQKVGNSKIFKYIEMKDISEIHAN
ncbi:hypothetical protein ACT4YX_16725 [Acinetobacter baumannii]|nr:hypothetical protein [Acinetobacter baumannii]